MLYITSPWPICFITTELCNFWLPPPPRGSPLLLLICLLMTSYSCFMDVLFSLFSEEFSSLCKDLIFWEMFFLWVYLVVLIYVFHVRGFLWRYDNSWLSAHDYKLKSSLEAWAWGGAYWLWVSLWTDLDKPFVGETPDVSVFRSFSWDSQIPQRRVLHCLSED